MKTSQATALAAIAASSKTRTNARETRAANDPFFLLLVRLRGAILLQSTLHESKMRESPFQALPISIVPETSFFHIYFAVAEVPKALRPKRIQPAKPALQGVQLQAKPPLKGDPPDASARPDPLRQAC
jgi:hypothetical protein